MDTGLSALSSVTCNVEKWKRFGFSVDVVTLALSWLEALKKVSIVIALLANCTCACRTGAPHYFQLLKLMITHAHNKHKS